MTTKKKGEDDGVVTSAPASKVGSLLADLLNDAKAGVAQEQKKIETEADRRAREEREVRDREEARKREEAQKKLIEEARLRNEALAKRDRAEGLERKALSTAPHMRPVAAEPVPVAAVAAVAPAVAPAKTTSKLLLAALVLVGIGLGFGASFALSPAQKDAGIDIGAAAKAVVAASRKQASAEGKFAAELDAARARIGDLQREVGEAQAATKNLEKVVDGLKADLATAQAAIEAGKNAPTDAPKGPKRTGTSGSSIPGINGSVFNPK